jgi:hypothetical protein
MNRFYTHAFESLDERAFQMSERLRNLLSGEIDIEDLADDCPIDPDDDQRRFQ